MSIWIWHRHCWEIRRWMRRYTVGGVSAGVARYLRLVWTAHRVCGPREPRLRQSAIGDLLRSCQLLCLFATLDTCGGRGALQRQRLWENGTASAEISSGEHCVYGEWFRCRIRRQCGLTKDGGWSSRVAS